MIAKNEKGIANMDYVVALIVFIIGSVAVLGLYFNVYKTIAKIKVDETIIGYITEICETIDLENYESVNSQEKVKTIIESAKIPKQYKVECVSIERYNNVKKGDELDVVEKINLNISYEFEGTQRNYTISKVKVKE